MSEPNRRELLAAGVTTAGAAILTTPASSSLAASTRANGQQNDWRWCGKCQGLAFANSRLPGRCPSGGPHNHFASFDYILTHGDSPPQDSQRNWRYCRKCEGLAFAGHGNPGVCPAGGRHDHAVSLDYILNHGGNPPPPSQSNWRWCWKCQGLAFAGHGPGVCPAGGRHDHTVSNNYVLLNDPRPEAAPRIDTSYYRYKQEVLTKFTDRHGLIVNLNNGRPDGIGDSAWRTGLAALSFVLERDNAMARKYLQALKDACWNPKSGPIRHPEYNDPDPNKVYSRDQFIPQMAACFFAEYFADEATKVVARSLYQGFVNTVMENPWRLNQGEAADLDLANQFAFYEVADKLNTDGGRVRRHLAGKQVGGAAGERIVRTAFITAMRLKAAELAKPNIVKLLNDGNPVFQFYGVHLMFLEALIVTKTRPQTEGLWDAAKDVGGRAGAQEMLPFLWLKGDFARPTAALVNWPPAWNRVDYVWQRSKGEQENDAKAPPDKNEYPRLDYMLLRTLFNVDLDRK